MGRHLFLCPTNNYGKRNDHLRKLELRFRLFRLCSNSISIPFTAHGLCVHQTIDETNFILFLGRRCHHRQMNCELIKLMSMILYSNCMCADARLFQSHVSTRPRLNHSHNQLAYIITTTTIVISIIIFVFMIDLLELNDVMPPNTIDKSQRSINIFRFGLNVCKMMVLPLP